MKHKPSAVPINTSKEVQLEDADAVLVKRRRIEFSGSTVQPQLDIEISDMEKKTPNGLPVEVSTGDDPMDMLTDCAVQSSGEVNGCSNGNIRSIPFTGNEPARLKLPKLCVKIGWKIPSFDFEEQGPPHNKLKRKGCLFMVDFNVINTIHLQGDCPRRGTRQHCYGVLR
ncbi:unnamed protein product [Urochloa decumbens]|uniref:Uncharacterized protein n=1 Tax=Urochloa decumbens TaxID=240449 RepID=A0ABC9EWQ7_9POAL